MDGVRRALAVALALILPVSAAGQSGREPSGSAPAPKPTVTPGSGAGGVTTYQLPSVGKPRRRIGGGRRGPGDPLPELWALVPDHVGLTTSAAPSLFWYISNDARGYVVFELTLIDEASVAPLVDVRVPAPARGGIQRVNLAEHGVALKPGQEYQWSLALVVDPAQRSRDLVATGWIERVPEPDDLAARLAASDPAGRANVYAGAGLWYDALGALADEEARRPGDPEPRRQRNALLGQVGLPAIPEPE
jgi:hypothetical protein